MKKNILLLVTLISILSCKSKDSGLYDKCCDIAPVEIDLNPGKIYIPNIFTPFGDGINDLFFPYTDSGIELIEIFRVTNKDGEVLTQKFDIILPQNSSFLEGYPSPSQEPEFGLLTCFIRVRNTNGESFDFETSFCSYNCGGDVSDINLPNCGFPNQHDGQGGFDPNLFQYETDCFNWQKRPEKKKTKSVISAELDCIAIR